MTTPQKATFGAGCFWDAEAAFRRVPGVLNTAVGYAGGTTPNPTDEDISSGRTGHTEVVEVEYDPATVPYERLLDIFWAIQDPTIADGQDPDTSSLYRSVIYFHTPEQAAIARASKEQLGRSGRFRRPIVTEIAPAPAFYRAEEYHQCYLEKRGASHRASRA